MYGKSNNPKNTKKLKSTSPIRVLVKCGWSGARLTVPTDPTPINGKSTLLEIILRLESGLPPALFASDSKAASLVCLRKIVQKSDWDTTTLRQILDGDDGSAGVVLTLDLGSGGGGNNGVQQQSNPVKKAIDSAASSLNIKPQVVQSGAPSAPSAMQIDERSTTTAPSTAASVPPASTTSEQPMDIDGDAPPTPTINNKVVTTEDAWKHILQSNFDATTKDCLNTLLKIIDNIISRPNEPKVRSIRCANAAIEKKVGRCTGGFDFLYSIGFIPKYPALGGQTPETLVLIPENESKETLLRGRKVLIDSAVDDLNMNGDDLPPVPKVKEAALPASTLAPPPSSTSTSSSRPNNNSRGPTSQFNVYKTHSHNIQSAAMGAPDPYAEAGMSSTERQLQNLQSKKERLEREMQDIESDRGLVVYRAGSGPAPIGATTTASSSGGGKTDSSLVAARMKRMEEERKKREEGGFTTKAMRDLEKMKKAKVYSHAQIRVNFPDGSNLHAKFLPREKVSSIRSVIKSAFQPSLVESLDFDLYVAPPRRLLDKTKRLDEEELVPAAKIHVSWKVGGSPSGSYLRNELFSGGSNMAAFPDAKPIVKQKQSVAASAKANGGISGGGGPSKEELMMQKMLGKKPGLFGGKKSSSGDSNKDDTKKGGGKPKWFKG